MAQLNGNQPAHRARRAVPVLIALALQVALAGQVDILGGRPNFMVALACALAPGMPAGPAALLGFACGLAFDLTASVPVGLTALLLTVACFALSCATSGHALGLSSAGIRLTVAAVIAVELVYGVAMALMGQAGLVSSVVGHGLITGVISALVSLAFLPFGGEGDSGRGFSGRPSGTRYKVLR